MKPQHQKQRQNKILPAHHAHFHFSHSQCTECSGLIKALRCAPPAGAALRGLDKAFRPPVLLRYGKIERKKWVGGSHATATPTATPDFFPLMRHNACTIRRDFFQWGFVALFGRAGVNEKAHKLKKKRTETADFS